MRKIIERCRIDCEAIDAKIAQFRKLIHDCNEAKSITQKTACRKLAELPEFRDLIGKKCVLFTRLGKQTIGYFEGFEVNIIGDFAPVVYKVKKDGTKSAMQIPSHGLPDILNLTIKKV